MKNLKFERIRFEPNIELKIEHQGIGPYRTPKLQVTSLGYLKRTTEFAEKLVGEWRSKSETK